MAIVWRFLRLLRWTILIVLAFVTGMVLVLTLTEKGRDNLAGLISDVASSDDMKIKLSGLDGIWSGYLKVGDLVIEDADGPWLAVRGAEIDWSPLALFSWTVRTERIHADRIEVARRPKTNTSSGGGGGLPVRLSLKGIDLPDVALGPELAGGVASVSAKGFVEVSDAPMVVDSELDIARTDGKAGSVAAKVTFVPADNKLDIDIVGSEPKGGIIANLLQLPGEPAVDVLVSGSGPAANWKGSGTISIDKTVVTRIEGTHVLTNAGSRIEAKGDGEFARFLPERFRPVLSGRTVFDIIGTRGNDGAIAVERADIESNALKGTAKGTINPAGVTDFALELNAANGGLPLVFGSTESPIDITVGSASIRAFGDGKTPALDIAATLPLFATSNTKLENIAIALHSDEFDMQGRIGPVSGNATAAALIIDNPTLAPLVAGKVSAELEGTLSTEAFSVSRGVIRSDAIDGNFSGTVALTNGVIGLDLNAVVLSSALPAPARPALADKVTITAELVRDDQGNTSANSLAIKSGGLTGNGQIKLGEQNIDVDLKGRIADIGAFAPQARGTVDFALVASGDKRVPDVTATITSDQVSAAGRELKGLNLTASGKADMANPAFAIKLGGDLSGKPLQGSAVVGMAGDSRELRDIAVSLGDNRITGALKLADDNLPEGALSFELKNIAALTAPAAPDLKGSVAGTATFGRDGGTPQLVVDATANAALGANAADGVKLNATVTDYLAAPQIAATVTVPAATAGDTQIKDAEVKLSGTPQALSFDAKATARDVPVVAQGTLRPGEGGVAVNFDRLEANVQGVPVELSSPAAIASASGVTTFDNLAIDLGGGKAVVSGTAGETLDLTVQLTDVPASLANSFRPDLDAAGTVSGSARVTGSSASPAVAFDIALADGEVAQTRAAGLQPLGITAKGTFADKALAFDAAVTNPEGVSLGAKGNVTLGEGGPETIGLAVNSTIVSLPASLANALVPNLGAAGIIEGTLNATGTAANPSLAYDLRWSGAETAQGRAAGVPPLALTAKGTYADKAVGFAATARNASGLAVNADGSVTLGTSIEDTALAVNASIAAFPAALANSFVPGLDAAGTIEGTLNTTGPASAPSVAYDLRWNGAETSQTRARGIAPLNVTAKGNFAEGALGFAVAARNGQGIALDTNGTAKLAGEQVEANVTGRLADVAPLAQGASGAVDFSLAASGAKATPDLSLEVSSDRLTAAGREITRLKLSASGKADMANPAASVTLAGNVAGQALNGNAVLSTAQGKRTIRGLSLTLGPNRIAGDLELDDAFVPLGSINFDVPDLGPLAALAFETVSGSLSGNAQFSRENGVPRIVADATVRNFARGEIGGKDIALDATVDDYLTAPVVSGMVRAASVTSGKTVVSNIAVDLSRDSPWTAFDGGATVSGIPAKAKGRVQSAGGATTIELSSAEAVVQGIRAAVANSTTVRIADGRTTLDNLIVRLGSGQAIVSGSAGEVLDLNVRLSALPASLANSFSPGLGAAGNISGTVKVTGAASAPSVAYDINGSGVEVAQTRAAGVGGLSVTSAGTFAGNRLSFNATAGGAGGLSVRAGGSVNTAAGPSLDLTVTGTLPFSVLSGRLAAQGLALSGSAAVDLRITGTAASPIIAGSITSTGSRFIDSRSGIALNDLGADIAISNGVATVRRLGGSLSGGGSVSVTGTVGINPGGGFPADLAIRLADARYTDGRVVTANLGGDLAIKGPLTSVPTLSGTINLARTVITIPERLPSSLSTLDVKHKNAPAAVRRQDKALKPAGTSGGGGSGGLLLDLTVNAPERIFVQGRGLDAELGGSVRLTGSTAAPQAVGQFDLRRGRLQLLGKRLTFTTGSISFAGSLVPTIDFSADTTATDATVTVGVSGQATNPRFAFTSSPALPEDEVLARLVFGRSMSNLSPLQIAQLADAVAQLSGSGGSTGLLQALRSKIGIDDLDIRTDEKGGTSVAAGKYLNDRTYLSLEKGEKPGSGKATIDLDVGKGVKLRGQASDSGEAKGGIFFEREY